jgi:cleavage and polyadenylation specificity factor subunit 3
MSIQVLGDQDGSLEIIPLGSGQEVGRSCVVVRYRGKSVMFDCGVHPAHSGFDSLPYFDDVDPEAIDLLLITHFHLDHCGATPYFVQRTKFRGHVFMTHPTKALFRMVMHDFMRVGVAGTTVLFTEGDLHATCDKIETIDYHQELAHNGIKFKCYNAGHVLGAAMFMVEIAGVRVLYTGDYSRYPDRHLMGAETPDVSPDVLIVESTYGIQEHERREEREARFLGWVDKIVKRGGRCLIPVFALGRAQELLLILDEYWDRHPELQQFPVYYASALAKRCMTIFQTYINMMNDRIRRQYAYENPFHFKWVRSLDSLEHFEDAGPSVVLASPGMLQPGTSRDLFERWCTDMKSGCIFAGYSVEGTLAKQVSVQRPNEIVRQDGKTVPLAMTIEEISFSAHSDFAQTREFVATIDVGHVVLVHGDQHNCRKLKDRLTEEFRTKKLQVYSPKNTDVVRIQFAQENIIKVLGTVASEYPKPNGVLKGLLVSKDFQHAIVAPEDLALYTSLQVGAVRNTVIVPLHRSFSLKALLVHLHKYYMSFSSSDIAVDDDTITLLAKAAEPSSSSPAPSTPHFLAVHISKTVQLSIERLGTAAAPDGDFIKEVGVTWVTSRFADLIADATVMALLHLYGTPRVKVAPEVEDDLFRVKCMQQMLSQHFTGLLLDMSTFTFSFTYMGKAVRIVAPLLVECDDADVTARVNRIVQRIFLTLYPLPLADEGLCC